MMLPAKRRGIPVLNLLYCLQGTIACDDGSLKKAIQTLRVVVDYHSCRLTPLTMRGLRDTIRSNTACKIIRKGFFNPHFYK